MEIQHTLEELIKKVDEKIKDAEENLGDIEVRDAILEKAEIYKAHDEIEKTIETYD